ncbi:MAG: class I SAM-dependent methyltransferase [Elusimicrobia bacterium]|nr:class I SAM-dependent methyltransferase [Elusimicrobiota bacterium]
MALIKKSRKLSSLSARLARRLSPEKVILLEYPVNPKPRWDKSNPHRELYDIIKRNSAAYKNHLRSFLPLADYFAAIPKLPTSDSSIEPFWNNGWTPPLDAVALSGFIAANKPKYYMEVGSGISTKFAKKIIAHHNLPAKIISIDPHPRFEINSICDEIVREPLEDANLEVFDRLNANDILYIDDSHRTFMNSDATAAFLDVIPRLKPGVLVGIHDITLPYDYPQDWADRYFSEQYLLAAYLLAKGGRFDIVLPITFISHDDELKNILSPLWEREEMKNIQPYGYSFWLRIK